jgi:hypothetical protein
MHRFLQIRYVMDCPSFELYNLFPLKVFFRNYYIVTHELDIKLHK